MHTSLILYAEHEFNASTFAARVVAGTGADMYSAIVGGIGALRGPKHGGANEVALEIQSRYASEDEAEADIRRRVAAKEVIIGFGHAVYTVADPRNAVIKQVAKRLSEQNGDTLTYRVADRIESHDVGAEEDVRQPRLVQRRRLQPDADSDRDVHADLRHLAHQRLGRARHGAARRQQADPPDGELHRTGEPEDSCRSQNGSLALSFA